MSPAETRRLQAVVHYTWNVSLCGIDTEVREESTTTKYDSSCARQDRLDISVQRPVKIVNVSPFAGAFVSQSKRTLVARV